MAQTINGKIPAILKLVFELRYRQGYSYLDRCGRTLNLIQEYFPEWILGGNPPNPQNTSLINVQTGTKFSFDSGKLNLAFDRQEKDSEIKPEQVKVFASQAEDLSALIIDQLGLADFSRVGCRIWYLFHAETEEDSYKFLHSLGFFNVSPQLAQGFDGEIEKSSAVITIAGKDRHFRIGLEVLERTIEVDLGDSIATVPIKALPSGERKKALVDRLVRESKKRKYPAFGAMVDVDASREEPPASLKYADFVTQSIEYSLNGIRRAVSPALS